MLSNSNQATPSIFYLTSASDVAFPAKYFKVAEIKPFTEASRPRGDCTASHSRVLALRGLTLGDLLVTASAPRATGLVALLEGGVDG